MKNKLPYLLLIPLLLSSCNGQGNTGNKYQTKTINVYYFNEDNNTTCDIRYYGKQEADSKATISREEQIDLTVSYIVDFINA